MAKALEKYRTISMLGQGAYGTVWLAINLINGERVAIKILNNFFNSEECFNLPEIKIVKRITNHANIVDLKEAVFCENVVYIVFEYIQGNSLYNLMEKRRQPFSEIEVKKWILQVLQGLSHAHERGFVHRDIKPENLLLTADNNVKIADFGLALDMNSVPDMMSRGCNVVGTMDYMAPEILLGSKSYDETVDYWSVGATMAELLSFYPLFPGSNDRFGQLLTICYVIGSPKPGEWDEGFQLAKKCKFEFPMIDYGGVHDRLSILIPTASDEAIDMIRLLCSWNPRRRPNISQVLKHPFFKGVFSAPPMSYSKWVIPPPGFSPLPPISYPKRGGPPPGFNNISSKT